MKYVLNSKFRKKDRVVCKILSNTLSNIRKIMFFIPLSNCKNIYEIDGTIREVRFIGEILEFVYLVEFTNGERMWVTETNLTRVETYEDKLKKVADSI